MAVVSPGPEQPQPFKLQRHRTAPPTQDCPGSHRDCPSRGGAQESARLTPWGHRLSPQRVLGVAVGRQPQPSGRTA